MAGQAEGFGQVHGRHSTERDAPPLQSSARLQATGLLLAGGRSTRFGTDKAAASLAGIPLAQHVAARLAQVCSELVVVRAPDQEYPVLDVDIPVRRAKDRVADEGPLVGIVTGLEAATNELAFAVATDAPLISLALVEAMLGIATNEGCDVVCPDVGGYRQPLVAVYRKSTCLPVFERSLAAGNRRILLAYEGLTVISPDEEAVMAWDPELDSFRNANTPDALAELEELLAEGR